MNITDKLIQSINKDWMKLTRSLKKIQGILNWWKIMHN